MSFRAKLPDSIRLFSTVASLASENEAPTLLRTKVTGVHCVFQYLRHVLLFSRRKDPWHPGQKSPVCCAYSACSRIPLLGNKAPLCHLVQNQRLSQRIYICRLIHFSGQKHPCNYGRLIASHGKRNNANCDKLTAFPRSGLPAAYRHMFRLRQSLPGPRTSHMRSFLHSRNVSWLPRYAHDAGKPRLYGNHCAPIRCFVGNALLHTELALRKTW